MLEEQLQDVQCSTNKQNGTITQGQEYQNYTDSFECNTTQCNMYLVEIIKFVREAYMYSDAIINDSHGCS